MVQKTAGLRGTLTGVDEDLPTGGTWASSGAPNDFYVQGAAEGPAMRYSWPGFVCHIDHKQPRARRRALPIDRPDGTMYLLTFPEHWDLGQVIPKGHTIAS